jgi:hypothetical protein
MIELESDSASEAQNSTVNSSLTAVLPHASLLSKPHDPSTETKAAYSPPLAAETKVTPPIARPSDSIQPHQLNPLNQQQPRMQHQQPLLINPPFFRC